MKLLLKSRSVQEAYLNQKDALSSTDEEVDTGSDRSASPACMFDDSNFGLFESTKQEGEVWEADFTHVPVPTILLKHEKGPKDCVWDRRQRGWDDPLLENINTTNFIFQFSDPEAVKSHHVIEERDDVCLLDKSKEKKGRRKVTQTSSSDEPSTMFTHLPPVALTRGAKIENFFDKDDCFEFEPFEQEVSFPELDSFGHLSEDSDYIRVSMRERVLRQREELYGPEGPTMLIDLPIDCDLSTIVESPEEDFSVASDIVYFPEMKVRDDVFDPFEDMI